MTTDCNFTNAYNQARIQIWNEAQEHTPNGTHEECAEYILQMYNLMEWFNYDTEINHAPEYNEALARAKKWANKLIKESEYFYNELMKAAKDGSYMPDI